MTQETSSSDFSEQIHEPEYTSPEKSPRPSLTMRLRQWRSQTRARAAERKRLILRSIELKRLKRIRRKTVPAYRHCKNCGKELQGMYCSRCGQYALDPKQPFSKYLLQYFENVYQFDGKVWVTLYMLFRRPGFLTKEFNAGKIASYVHPMRLLMFITVVFFLFFFKFMGNQVNDYLDRNINLTSENELFNQPMETYDSLISDTVVSMVTLHDKVSSYSDIMQVLSVSDAMPYLEENFLEENLSSQGNPALWYDTLMVKMNHEVLSHIQMDCVGTWKGTPLLVEVPHSMEEYELKNTVSLFNERIINAISGSAPLTSLLLIPVLALLFKAFYRKSQLPYMSHFVFSLHLGCFFFLLLSIYLLAGHFYHYPSWMLKVFLLLMILYCSIASHQVYRGNSWFKVVLKTIVLGMIYSFIVLIAVAGILVYFIYQNRDVAEDVVGRF